MSEPEVQARVVAWAKAILALAGAIAVLGGILRVLLGGFSLELTSDATAQQVAVNRAVLAQHESRIVVLERNAEATYRLLCAMAAPRDREMAGVQCPVPSAQPVR